MSQRFGNQSPRLLGRISGEPRYSEAMTTNRTASPSANVILDHARFDAVIFDLDGVVTQTAHVHAAAWKVLFDEYFDRRTRRGESDVPPFDVVRDYRLHVDGKPRHDGIRSFLQTRGIELPPGEPSDAIDRETVCGLAKRKNQSFLEQLKQKGVQTYESTVRLLDALQAQGFPVAIISASENAAAVLEAAGLLERFDTRVDGLETKRLALQGKPAPDVFLEAARRLGVTPARTVVIEDAIAGVQAGRAGGFGCVIGVDRMGQPEDLRTNGADVVVSDLAEVSVQPNAESAMSNTADLPSALERIDAILSSPNRSPVVFLDYDGTLTPIVAQPEDAVLSDSMRAVVQRLARLCTVAVISGRDLPDVRDRVAVKGIVYAGSHGFDIEGPGGLRRENEEAQACLPALDQAESSLREQLGGIPGARVERKRFSIAVHFRNVPEARVPEIEPIVDGVKQRHPNLRRSGGKKIFEVQPRIDWHKGRAVLWLLETIPIDPAGLLPIYLGDDLTDEDAFEALTQRGVNIVIRDEPRPTAAQYALENPGETGAFLELLANRLEKGGASESI
jgi:trehalose-phosphatase